MSIRPFVITLSDDPEESYPHVVYAADPINALLDLEHTLGASWTWESIPALSVRPLDEAAYRKFLSETAGVPAPGKGRRKPRIVG
jgi:hypothetical protein